MSYIVVDVEADSQSPAVGSMVCFGAVLVKDLSKTFYGKTKPIQDFYDVETLSISGFTREQHETFDDPQLVMLNFFKWIESVSVGRTVLISDNLAFDWKWIDYYFYKFVGTNPFGWSGRRIGDIYSGITNNAYKQNNWKRKYRKTKHTHNPVDDAKGNAEALIAFRDKLGFVVSF